MHIDPELRPIFDAMGPLDLMRDISAARAEIRARAAQHPPLPDDRFTVEDRTIPGYHGIAVPVRIYTPRGDGPFPLYIYMHGGCFISGDLDTSESQCRPVVTGANAVVISVDYRLAPEHPFPAQLDDSYAVLLWAAEHAAALSIDPARIAIGGRSAGGCLATAVATRARDEGGPALIHQFLWVPVTDDRLETPSSHAITDERILNRETLEGMWRHYLQGIDPATPYAVPMRTPDLAGLPPALVMTCELDPLRDEGLDYARRLMEAGVSVEIQQVPGAWHVFETQAPHSRLANRITGNWVAALDAALNGPQAQERPGPVGDRPGADPGIGV